MSFFWELERFGDRTAFMDEVGCGISYADLAQHADEFGGVVGRGSLFISLCENTVGSLAGYLGSLRSGATGLLLAGNTDKERLQTFIQNYRPKFCWLPVGRVEELQLGKVTFTFADYALVDLAQEDPVQLNPELALLLTTSGSTGSPVLIRQSRGNLSANANSIMESLGIVQSDRPITTLPMNYTYGLSIINSHLLKGCTVVLSTRPVTDRNFWQCIERLGVTGFGGVPYIYETLRRFGFSFLKYGKIRMLTQAGGKLKGELVKEFHDACRAKGIDFVVMYGQTEATARMSYLPPKFTSEKPKSIGIAIPGGRFQLEDDKGCVIADTNVVGELVYEGENVTLGYARTAEDLAKGNEFGGVLRTGDLAYRDEDGFYYIAGRKKRFVKLFGNRVSLDEVEAFVSASLCLCACVGSDDRLFIYVTDESRLVEVALQTSKFLGLHSSAIKVRPIGSIPRNDSGKVQYSQLSTE
jgi:acyl-coenzyme A synthetase/AMP-(fatty) acid ligase